MNEILMVFTGIVAVFTVISLSVLWISTYPPRFIVKLFQKFPRHNITEYYFYYNKATAYRLLFTCFSIFGSILKVLATASTFITVYVAVNESDYVILSSLISATCQVISFMLQPEKYTKPFSDAALTMEYALLKEYVPPEKTADKLFEAYQQAEEIISKTK